VAPHPTDAGDPKLPLHLACGTRSLAAELPSTKAPGPITDPGAFAFPEGGVTPSDRLPQGG
jgi:hypothetical protein